MGLIQKTHYVLMLDMSGSMTDIDENGTSRWQNLKDAVSGFVKIIEADLLLKNNSRLSMITYNTSAKVIL